jgi:23S rRNA pseudouridine1911/1915/1917 synthase
LRISDLILDNNQQYIAVNKPSAMPVQEDLTSDVSLHRLVQAYCKHDVYLWNRIDRPASGIVLFPKQKKALATLNDQQKKGTILKKYLAVVKKGIKEDSGTLVHFLHKKSGLNKMRVYDESKAGTKEARMTYRKISEIDNYILLEVILLTGRQHQIRAQLGHIGFPVRGDVKYGFKRPNADRSIHLHAWKLIFNHPVSGEMREITSAPPLKDPVWGAFSFDFS